MRKPIYKFTWQGKITTFSVKARDIAMARDKVSTLLKINNRQTIRWLSGFTLKVEEI